MKTFTPVPHWLLDMVASGALSGAVIVTYVAVGKYVNFKDGEPSAWPSQATLAQATGLSERTVRQHLAEMEQAGVIKRQQRNGPSGRTSDLITLAQGDDPGTGRKLPLPPGRKLPGNDNQLNKNHPEEISPSSVTTSPTRETSTKASDTVSDPPDWVKRLEWMNPEKFTMSRQLAEHLDVVAVLGHYVAWSQDKGVDQSFTRFWSWLAKAEAEAKAAKNDEDINVRLMRTVREQQQREQQV